MSWSALQESVGDTLYCWFPGWSFNAEVFSSLYQQLPGSHLGAHYVAAGDMENYARELALELHQNINKKRVNDGADQNKITRLVFIGWSLGGALAVHCLRQFQAVTNIPTALITLATGERFLQQSEDSEQGMAEKTFSAFSASLDKFPTKTTKRFLGLCTQHADNPRDVMRLLANSQISDESVLKHSLQWLNYSALPLVKAPQLHLYSAQDGFNPRRMTSEYQSSESSHCFFLTETGLTDFLNAVQAIKKVQESH